MNKTKELLVPIYLKNGMAQRSLTDETVVSDAVRLAVNADHHGADALLVFDLSKGDAEHEAALSVIKDMSRATDLPIYGGGNIKRLEDVKKLLYAGCRKVFLNYSKESNVELTAEASLRFGAEKILACVKNEAEAAVAVCNRGMLGGAVAVMEMPVGFRVPDEFLHPVYVYAKEVNAAVVAGVGGIYTEAFLDAEYDFMEAKHALKKEGISMNTFASSMNFSEFKLGPDGLLPVIVEDYRTGETLMQAYMNEEAFDLTVRTGRMTYYSRSRQEIWVKGLTSGHFQYVRALLIDCDNDTLLAKVVQVGAACHTGNRSCFYRTILKKEYNETNPLKVFEDVFAVIQDRKLHPKEGSYTNYLFNKGIDKILKKVGEEATEIVIAAKNPDAQEIVYEISDFLYHVMVLMAEKGVGWEDITEELAKR